MESEEILNARRTNAVRLALKLEGMLNTKFTLLRTEVLAEALESETSNGRVTKYFGVIKIIRPENQPFLYAWFTNTFRSRFKEVVDEPYAVELFTDEAGTKLPTGTEFKVFEIYDLDDGCKLVFPEDGPRLCLPE